MIFGEDPYDDLLRSACEAGERAPIVRDPLEALAMTDRVVPPPPQRLFLSLFEFVDAAAADRIEAEDQDINTQD